MDRKLATIPPEKEYDACRQEILKRLEFQTTYLNIKLTIVAALMGFGINNHNNILILIVPLFELPFAIMWKHNMYSLIKIVVFLKHKFEHISTDLDWITFADHEQRKKGLHHLFLNIGNLGIFIIAPIASLIIGISNSQRSVLEYILISIDILATTAIVLTFLIYQTSYMRKKILQDYHSIYASS